MDEKDYGYCDRCRKKILNEADIYYIILDKPKKGLDSILSKNKKFKICQNCFTKIETAIENYVIGKERKI